MTKTTQQLATRVLERLKVLSAGETPDATDAKTVKDYYSGAFAELQLDGLTYWEETVIPDEAFEALSDLIAGRLGPDFGTSRPDLEASGDLRLRRLTSEGPSGLIVSGTYF